jgi:hypothetical protein
VTIKDQTDFPILVGYSESPRHPRPRPHMPELESLVLQRPQLQQRIQRAGLRNLEALEGHGIDGRGHTHARVTEAEEHAAGAECVRDGLRVRRIDRDTRLAMEVR